MTTRVKLPEPVAKIYHAVAELEARYHPRKFTPDGHLVGSIGEVVAAEALGLTLYPMSRAGHDACDGETSNLSKRQICVQRSAWQGQVGVPKGGHLRYVPMTTRLAAALRDARHLRGARVLYQGNGDPLTEKVVQTLLLRAAKRAGVANNGPHVLRHTFCSHLAMRGAPARAIQELAGHHDLTTTQRYMHLSPAALEHAIQLLDRPASAKNFGDVGETGDRQIGNVNG